MPVRYIILMLFLAGSTGCNNPGGPEKNKIYTYYDLEGLLERQLVLLDSLNPAVNKTARIDTITEREVLRLDSAAWSRELDVFFQADINAPVLQDSYRMSEEGQGDQTVKTFEAKDREKAGVEYLKVYFKQDTLQKVEAFYKEKNALYNSQRKMVLNFQSTGQKPLLASYEVEGKHKMIMKDPVTFQIEAELAY